MKYLTTLKHVLIAFLVALLNILFFPQTAKVPKNNWKLKTYYAIPSGIIIGLLFTVILRIPELSWNKLALFFLAVLPLSVSLLIFGFRNIFQSGSTITSAPASLISHVLELMMSKKHFERVIEPVIADWHEEYFEEIDGQNRRAKLFFMRIRYSYRLAIEVLSAGVIERIKNAFEGLVKAISSN